MPKTIAGRGGHPTINSHVMKARRSATLRPRNPPHPAERRDRSVLDRFNGDFGPDLQRSVLAPLSLTIDRFLLGMLPALVTVLFAGVISLLALLMDKQRRDYALQVADRFYNFAAVLVGAQPGHDNVDTEQHRPPPATEPAPLDREAVQRPIRHHHPVPGQLAVDVHQLQRYPTCAAQPWRH